MQIVEGKVYFPAPPIHNLEDILYRGLEKYAERPAFRFRMKAEDEAVLSKSYREVYEDVLALQAALRKLGVEGGRIAVLGDNSYPWVLTYLATVSGLGLIVPLDRLLPAEELVQLLERGEVDTLVYDASFHQDLSALWQRVPTLKHCLCMQEQRERKFERFADVFAERHGDDTQSGPLCLLWREVLAGGRELRREQAAASTSQKAEQAMGTNETATVAGASAAPTALSPERQACLEALALPALPPVKDVEAPMALIFTSGTTAASKAVLLNHRCVAADVRALLSTVRFKDPLRTLSFLPLHHTFENTCGFLSVMALGGCIHFYDGLRYIAKNLQEHGPEMIVAVPTIFEMLYKKITSGIRKSGQERRFNRGRRLSKFLRFFGIDVRRKLFKTILEQLGGNLYIAISGAAALDVKIIRFFDEIGVEILQGYGMTECSPVVAGCNTQVNRMGTIGQPLAGVTLAIDNQQKGETGEILIKGPMTMLGYYQNDEANAEIFTEDGWLRSGDIGRFDKHDCLHLTGRCKSMIVLPSGKKVFPEELEKLLNQHALIRDSMVFGQEDEQGDVVLTAKIVLDEEKLKDLGEDKSSLNIPEMIQHYIDLTNEALPSFKGIRSFVYSFNDMVRTTTMKVRRGVEVDQMKKLIHDSKLSWKELSGKNIEDLQGQVQPATPTVERAKVTSEPTASDAKELKSKRKAAWKQLKEEQWQAVEAVNREHEEASLARKTDLKLLKERYKQEKEAIATRYLATIKDIQEREKTLKNEQRAARKHFDETWREAEKGLKKGD